MAILIPAGTEVDTAAPEIFRLLEATATIDVTVTATGIGATASETVVTEATEAIGATEVTEIERADALARQTIADREDRVATAIKMLMPLAATIANGNGKIAIPAEKGAIAIRGRTATEAPGEMSEGTTMTGVGGET